MNPFLNPVVGFTSLKYYLTVPKRITKLSPKQMEKYRDKAFKKTIEYAYKTPLYHQKYKDAGIHPRDIHGIKDIKKLPYISKKDIRNNFPDGIIPTNYNKKKGYIIATGGTTGKSVFLYTDLLSMAESIQISVRELNHFGFNHKKTRFAHIGNLSTNRIDLVMEEKLYGPLKTFFNVDHILNMDVNQPIKTLINKLDSFKPDLLVTYPAIHQHLAFLKKKGYGKNFNPKLLFSAGAMLDEYTRSYVEDVFGCRLLNSYPSVEAGTNIAFECKEGTWHVHHDFFHLEAIDDNQELVAPGERGHLVITKLYGRGTPIVRYTGMDDWVRIIDKMECNCGLKTPVIKGGVEGRMKANIILPNGKIFPPGAFCFIEPVLKKFNTFKVKQYQIIQKKIDEIEILLVIDEDLRNVGVSVEEIKENIKQTYREKVGPDVTINVKEVDEIKHPKDARKPPPIVISHVTSKNGYKQLEN